MNTSARGFAVPVLAVLALAACAPAERRAERPQGAAAPQLETGITSSNGGGARALGNTPDVGVTTPVGRAR